MRGRPAFWKHAMLECTTAKLAGLTVADQTDYPEVIAGLRHQQSGGRMDPRIPYSQFSRIIDICCMAEMLRNFNITSLRGDEIGKFLELQSFFLGLEDRCLSEAGIE